LDQIYLIRICTNVFQKLVIQVFSGRNQCYGHAGNRDECLIGSECKREKERERECARENM